MSKSPGLSSESGDPTGQVDRGAEGPAGRAGHAARPRGRRPASWRASGPTGVDHEGEESFTTEDTESTETKTGEERRRPRKRRELHHGGHGEHGDEDRGREEKTEEERR
jgi:hypothetical protein